jgi:hypothetical protein
MSAFAYAVGNYPIQERTLKSRTFAPTEACASPRALLPHCDYARRARVERLVIHLHALGPRVLAEFLDALAAEHGIGAEIAQQLKDYRNLSPDEVTITGADRFPFAPTRRVEGAR